MNPDLHGNMDTERRYDYIMMSMSAKWNFKDMWCTFLNIARDIISATSPPKIYPSCSEPFRNNYNLSFPKVHWTAQIVQGSIERNASVDLILIKVSETITA